MFKKDIIEKNFSAYAEQYDEYALIQNMAGSMLIDKIDSIDMESPIDILEIGCGPGNYTGMLYKKFPNSRIYAVDISSEMINKARSNLACKNINYIVSDAEALNFDIKFDLITSNATFQWFQDLEGSIKKYKNLLKPSGMLLFCMFGPKTFYELSHIIQEIDNHNLSAFRFFGIDKIKRIVSDNFKDNNINEFIIQKEYKNLYQLLKTIKYTGTKGYGSKKVWSKSRVKKIENLYLKEYNRIKATYQLIFCSASVA